MGADGCGWGRMGEIVVDAGTARTARWRGAGADGYFDLDQGESTFEVRPRYSAPLRPRPRLFQRCW